MYTYTCINISYLDRLYAKDVIPFEKLILRFHPPIVQQTTTVLIHSGRPTASSVFGLITAPILIIVPVASSAATTSVSVPAKASSG